MLVTQKNIDATYKFAGIENLQKKLKEVLKTLDLTIYLEPATAKRWSENNPFFGFSEYIAEFVYFYIAPKGSSVKRIYIKDGKYKQYLWFIQWPDETVVDLTLQVNSQRPEYEKASKAKFKSKQPQTLTKNIAEQLGYSDDDLDIIER